MHILGVSCFYHDAAAALIRDGQLIAAAEEERFTRKKHDYGFPTQAITFCLKRGAISPEDLDYVVFYEKPLVKFERIFMTVLSTFPRSWETFRESMITWMDEKLWIQSLLEKNIGVSREKILFVDHHMAHAASALFCSPFSEAAILTVDGVGEWTTAAMGRGWASWENGGTNRIELSREMRFPHSLGLLYSAFTAFLGFEVNEGEYKVMGMAPFGQPRYMDRVFKVLELFADGSFWLDMDYFTYHRSVDRSFSDRFVRLFGEPRKPEEPFITPVTHAEASSQDVVVQRSQYFADVAASIQKVTEEILLKMANHLQRETGMNALCMAGGVALNSVANGRLFRETAFEDIFIHPAPGDSGGAVGAALYAWHCLLGKPRQFVLEHAFWGASYSEEEILKSLKGAGVGYDRVEDDARLLEQVVDSLVEGKVVGWYQGRFEWGPRALGNRSILADPRRSEMKQIVNAKIKFREPFRPFAPVILEERTAEFFDDAKGPQWQYPARYMLFVLPWKGAAGERVPAVNHLGTGRLQTIRREWNPRYHRVVEAFGEATGVPVLLNTSFNVRGEPIVASPADALNTFSKSQLDLLVMDQFLLTRDDLEGQRSKAPRLFAGADILDGEKLAQWLRCPVDRSPLVSNGIRALRCSSCGRTFPIEEGIPLLFWPTESSTDDDVTQLVKAFYEENPFPGYEALDTAPKLLEKARRSIFARLLDERIAPDARVLEVGCGTGQLSNYLGIRGRTVFGTDLSLPSLKLGRQFALDNMVDSVHFIQMNLFRPVFPEATFDVVICNGVLHHTPDPFGGFRTIAKLVKPGGHILIGLYNQFGRVWTDTRRALFRVSGNRLHYLDPYLARPDVDADKKRIWFLDQYRNPHESKHTVDEVLSWFDATGIEFVNAVPKHLPLAEFSPSEDLFAANPRGSRMAHLLAQLKLPLSGDHEGGFFVMIGRMKGTQQEHPHPELTGRT